MRLRIPVMAYLEREQKKKLDQLSEVTRVATAIYLREAVDDLLKKYARDLKYRPRIKAGEKPQLRLRRKR